MKKTIQTKRGSHSGSSYRVLYAKTGRKRRLNASTAAVNSHMDLESDVENVGIGKALLVILILHVLAIGAIYSHSKFFSDDYSDKEPNKAKVAATVVSTAEIKSPVVNTPVIQEVLEDSSKTRYIVMTGDSYTRIAQARNVDLQALRALNGDRALRAGVVLDLPNELSSRPVAVVPTTLPVEQVAVVKHIEQAPKRRYARAVEVDESEPAAVVVKPKRNISAQGLRDSGQRYTIKSGDTVWRIASRYKVSRETLLSINGLDDPRKLNVGRRIKIPTK